MKSAALHAACAAGKIAGEIIVDKTRSADEVQRYVRAVLLRRGEGGGQQRIWVGAGAGARPGPLLGQGSLWRVHPRPPRSVAVTRQGRGGLDEEGQHLTYIVHVSADGNISRDATFFPQSIL